MAQRRGFWSQTILFIAGWSALPYISNFAVSLTLNFRIGRWNSKTAASSRPSYISYSLTAMRQLIGLSDAKKDVIAVAMWGPLSQAVGVRLAIPSKFGEKKVFHLFFPFESHPYWIWNFSNVIAGSRLMLGSLVSFLKFFIWIVLYMLWMAS